MLKYVKYLAVALFATSATAHEWTPTYPVPRASFIDGVYVVTMTLINKREDVGFYEVEVYDEDWTPVEFTVTGGDIISISHLSRKTIDIYFSERDIDNIEYVCTVSKSLRIDVESSSVRSRICSRIKRE